MGFRTIGRTALLLLVCAWAWSGCSKQESAQHESGQATETHGGSTDAEAPPSGTTTAQPGEAGTTGGEVQLAGTLGCGHCTYHVTPDCSPCVKTAAGDVYVIDGVAEGSELMEKRFDGLEIAVVGTVIGSEDPKHVAMTSFEWK